MRRVISLSIPLAATVVTVLSAQPVFRGTEIFPPDEFAARRTRVFTAIGNAVAVVQERRNDLARSRSGRTISSST